MLRNIILISALFSITYTSTLADEPILPWYEKYLFPIGSWTSPENDGTIKPWLTANNIDIWEPQDCSTFADMGLDFARFRPLFGPPFPDKTTDYNDNDVPDRIEVAGKIADWIKPYGARLYWCDEYVFELLDSDKFVPDWGDPGNEDNPPYDEHACWPNYECDGQCMEDPPDPGKPAYVKIACKVASGSPTKNAYFDNIELIETNLVANGSFELAEEGPHHPDRWRYPGSVPPLPPGGPGWSALYDADSKYDRRCWRVRASDQSNITYASETFTLEPSTQYRLSGWLRNFDVEPFVIKLDGCKLKINLYDSFGNNAGSYETEEVRTEEEWTYKYVNFTTPSGVEVKYYGRVTVVEEKDAYSSAADGIRVLPTGGLQ